MIGIIAGEGWTVFEFKPLFVGKCFVDFHIKLPNFTQDDSSKEYGFAFGKGVLWIMNGDMSSYLDIKLPKFFNNKD